MTFEINPNAIQPEAKILWPDGPTRLWSLIRCNGAHMPQHNGGFAGNYVCQGCGEPVVGVYRVIHRVEVARNWICATCRDRERTKTDAQSKN